jgi:hypothetical protein
VNGVDDEVVARLDRLAEALVKPADREARDGERVDDDFVGATKRGRALEQPQEARGGRAAQQADEGAEQQPLKQGRETLASAQATPRLKPELFGATFFI